MHKFTLKTIGTLLVLFAFVALLGALLNVPTLADAGGAALAMAVVTKYGSGGLDPASKVHLEAIFRAAERRSINSLVVITNGDSIASKYLVGTIPTNAILKPGSTIDCQAITGATDCDLGLAYANGGTMIVVDCIVNGQTLASATSVTLRTATGGALATVANQNKRAWEIAGLTADPGGEFDIWLTINAAATATGNVNFDINYDKAA
jgi:hypothetical protein